MAEARPGVLRVEAHGAEFVDVEGAAEAPDALLAEYGRAAVLAPHGDVAAQHQRREDHEANGGDQHVHDALRVALEGVHPVGDEVRPSLPHVHLPHRIAQMRPRVPFSSV